MRKLFSIVVATLFATSLWATTTYEKVNSVPGQEAFIKNIKFDATTNTLSFVDNYKQGTLYDRKYVIDFYEWIETGSHATGLYKVTHNEGSSFIYGYPIMKSVSEIACVSITDISYSNHRVQGEYVIANSKGGTTSLKIGEEISKILEKGKTKLRIVVGLWYSKNGYYFSPETDKTYSEGREQNCYVNCYTGKFSYNDLYYRNPADLGKPECVYYGDSVRFMAYIKGLGQATYRLQESTDDETWTTVNTGIIAGKDVREGILLPVGWKFEEDGKPGFCYARLILEDNNSHVTDTSNVENITYLYQWKDGEHMRYHPADVDFNYPLPADCEKYYTVSALPVKQVKSGSSIRFTQPACNVEIKRMEPIYGVTFYNADNTILSVSMTKCGGTATPPADPTYGKYQFIGWSRDFTNVHKDISVYARYDLGGDYYFETAFKGHKNELHPMEGFADSETRAMIGDSLTFEAGLCAKFEMNLKYQIADTKDGEGNWLWSDPFPVGSFTTEDATKSWAEAKTFTVTRAVGYDNWQEKFNVPGYAFRFVVYCQEETVYSEPWEFDVYYPITVKSQIDAWYDKSLLEQLTVFNNSGDQYSGTTITVPARKDDTIWVAMEKGDGACMKFAREIKPDPVYAVANGEDELGRKFFICPNETETVDVTVKKYAVVFENAEPTSNYDFSAEGLHKWNNKYYAEVVRCGGAVKNMPKDPERAKELFLGWINNTTGEYADDDYKHVPALPGIEDHLIFEAKWENKPDITQHTVKFLDKDGIMIGSAQLVNDGDDAVPPTAPEVSGYLFAGWDKPYTCITADVDIKALYGKADKEYTVIYYDEDGSTELYSEKVLDNMAATFSAPNKVGKTFVGWLLNDLSSQPVDLQHVTADLNVKASYTDAKHSVTFFVDGVEMYATSVLHGTAFADITYPYSTPAKAATEEKVYTFKGWTPEVAVINGDEVFEAAFNEAIRKYEVIFQNWDHKQLDKQQVEYNAAAKEPAKPEREGFTFKGWDVNFGHIKTDLVVTAVFEKNKPVIPDEQGLEVLETGNPAAARKLLIDGTLYILLPDGKLYNATGINIR